MDRIESTLTELGYKRTPIQITEAISREILGKVFANDTRMLIANPYQEVPVYGQTIAMSLYDISDNAQLWSEIIVFYDGRYHLTTEHAPDQALEALNAIKALAPRPDNMAEETVNSVRDELADMRRLEMMTPYQYRVTLAYVENHPDDVAAYRDNGMKISEIADHVIHVAMADKKERDRRNPS